MSGLIRKSQALLLVKNESSYGVDPTPTAADNAIMVRNMTINPMEGTTAKLDYIRGYMGNSPSLRLGHYVTMQFDTDWMPGTSGPGAASPFGPLFRMAGLSAVGFETEITGTVVDGSATVTGTCKAALTGNANRAKISLAADTAGANDLYNGTLIELYAGTGRGQIRTVTDYVAATQLATVDTNWDVMPDATTKYRLRPFIRLAAGASSKDGTYTGLRVQNVKADPAYTQARTISAYNGANRVAVVSQDWVSGKVPAASDTYTVQNGYKYAPVSASFDSGTLYCYYDGLLHKIIGARANPSFKLGTNELPGLSLSVTGLYGGTVDTTLTGAVYNSFAKPAAANAANTKGSFFGLPLTGGADGLQMKSFSLDLGNQIEHRLLVGYESVEIVNRIPTGQIVMDMTKVAFFDFMTAVKEGHVGRIAIENGEDAGLSVACTMPRCQLDSLSYSEEQGIIMANIGYSALPVSGNDEVVISER